MLTRQPLPREFYDRPAPEVARDLLGRLLLADSDEGIVGGLIVETEAYLAVGDPGCHAARSCTPRNQAMFGPPGQAYVYRIHRCVCLNVVTGPEGVPEAVLIRALQPLYGLDAMHRRRGQQAERQLCSGPGKLCQALAVTLEDHQADLTASRLWIEGEGQAGPVVNTTRIGLRADKGAELLLRYYLAANQYISKR